MRASMSAKARTRLAYLGKCCMLPRTTSRRLSPLQSRKAEMSTSSPFCGLTLPKKPNVTVPSPLSGRLRETSRTGSTP